MLTFCIAGKNNIAVNALHFILEKFPQHSVIVCLNQHDTGINGWQKSLKYHALKWKIPIVKIEELYSLEHLLFLALEFDKIIKPQKFKTNRLFNIHFSKLPAYKGMFTSAMPLLNGDNESGVTLHRIDQGIDTGDIIDQMVFCLDLEINARDLYFLYLDHAFKLFKNNINLLVDNKYRARRQSFLHSSYYSKSSLNFFELKIILSKTAFEIHNQIRAFSFRDYQLPELYGKKVYKSQITNIASTLKSGSIIEQNKYSFTICTIDYNLQIFVDFQKELYIAAEQGDVEFIKNLKENEYPIGIRSDLGWDILIIACYYNQYHLVKFLLEEKWDVDTKNYKGTTALMFAMTALCEGRGEECFQLLLDAGANETLLDNNGKDISYYAKKYNNKNILTTLGK